VGGFEALTDRRQYLGVLRVRLGDLQENVSGAVDRQASLADNSQQGICGFILMMLDLAQRLQFLPRAILPSCLRFFGNVLLKGRNSFGRENFGWGVGHWDFAHFKKDAREQRGRLDHRLVSRFRSSHNLAASLGPGRRFGERTDRLDSDPARRARMTRRLVAPVEMRQAITAIV
jgi:hypothetical protein